MLYEKQKEHTCMHCHVMCIYRGVARQPSKRAELMRDVRVRGRSILFEHACSDLCTLGHAGV